MRKVKRAQLINITTMIAIHHNFSPSDIATLLTGMRSNYRKANDLNIDEHQSAVAVGNLVVFPPLDVNANIDKSKSAVAVGNLVVFPPLDVNNDKIKTKNLSSKLDVNVNIDKYKSAVAVGNLVVFPPLNVKNDPYTDANKISPLNILNNGFIGVSGLFCSLEVQAENGKFYGAIQEQDGSFTLTVAGLAEFKKDKEEAEKLQAGGDGGDGGGC